MNKVTINNLYIHFLCHCPNLKKTNNFLSFTTSALLLQCMYWVPVFIYLFFFFLLLLFFFVLYDCLHKPMDRKAVVKPATALWLNRLKLGSKVNSVQTSCCHWNSFQCSLNTENSVMRYNGDTIWGWFVLTHDLTLTPVERCCPYQRVSFGIKDN